MDSRLWKPARHQLFSAIAVFILTVSGCALQSGTPSLRLSESALDMRAMQTRTFTARSETEILAATIAALQDMEYNIDQIEAPLGVITASKVSDADSTSEKAGLLLLDLLCGCGMSQRATDRHAITITAVVLPSLAGNGEFVTRITIQQVTFSKQSQVLSRGTIDDPLAYQNIFDKLAKALYIEVANNA
jgi:hypothetical protein